MPVDRGWLIRLAGAALAVVAVAFFLWWRGGASEAALVKEETVVFGTRVAVTVAGAPPQQAQEAIGAVFLQFEDMHGRFHAWRDGELRRLNARIGAGRLPAPVSAPMAAMIARGKRFYAASEGLFNPAIGGLVALWGFHADLPPVAPPPAAAINAWREAGGADMAAFVVDGGELRAAPRAARLDFGALAKGVALDEARAILRARGIQNALIDVGGNIMALGQKNGAAWRVALAPDGRGQTRGLIELRDGEAMATSGGSERFFVYEGRRYIHILHPRTGYPPDNAAAAVVVADGAEAGARSDALATALVLADAAAAARLMQAFGVTLAWQTDAAPSEAMRRRLAEGGSGRELWR